VLAYTSYIYAARHLRTTNMSLYAYVNPVVALLLGHFIGSEDLTMYPILPPGSFIQVDESRDKVREGGWRSEYERPIYFVETREDHTCCWCTLTREEIILQPHPLSPVPPRVLRYPQQAEVIGQVVGVAMRLGEWHSVAESAPVLKERAELS